MKEIAFIEAFSLEACQVLVRFYSVMYIIDPDILYLYVFVIVHSGESESMKPNLIALRC